MRNKILLVVLALVLACVLCAAFPVGYDQPGPGPRPTEPAYLPPVVAPTGVPVEGEPEPTEAAYPAPTDDGTKGPMLPPPCPNCGG